MTDRNEDETNTLRKRRYVEAIFDDTDEPNFDHRPRAKQSRFSEVQRQRDDILDHVIRFLSGSPDRRCEMTSIQCSLDEEGFRSDDIMQSVISKNRQIFGLNKQPNGDHIVYLRKGMRSAHYPMRTLIGGNYHANQHGTVGYDEDTTADHEYVATRQGRPIQRQLASSCEQIARTPNQQWYLDILAGSSPVVVVVGPAGTGKTFLAVHAALRALSSGEVSRILVSRPAVPVDERLGFLPGMIEDKMAPYLAPVVDILSATCGPSELANMRRKGTVEVELSRQALVPLKLTGLKLICPVVTVCVPAHSTHDFITVAPPGHNTSRPHTGRLP